MFKNAWVLGLFRLKGLRDEQGFVVVLGATLIVGTIIAALSILYPKYIQSSIHSSEADHMEDVRSTFLKLKSEIESMEAGESGSFSIPMNPNFPPLVPRQGEAGTLSAKPGLAWVYGASIEIPKGDIWGSLDDLMGNDGKYLEINQVIFSERFQDTSGWDLTVVVDDNDTYTPAFDVEMTHADDGSGSIHVSVEASKDKLTSEEIAYWARDFDNLLENFPNVTVEGWFRKRVTYIPSTGSRPLVDVTMRIDVKDGDGWENGVLSYMSDNKYSITWKRGWSPFDNVVKEIRAYLSAWVKSSSAEHGQASIDLWWDGITLLEGPPFEVDVRITSEPIISPENVENIWIILNFCSKDSPAYYNLQICNFVDNDKWENLQSGIVGEGEVWWENKITVDSENYINDDGSIRIRITGKNENSPFRLCLDYLEFQMDYSGEFQWYYWGHYGSSGNTRFEINNNYYPDQTYSYEDGAVILAQDDSSVMASDPGLVVGRPKGDNIEVWVHHFVLTGYEDSVAGRGWSAVRVSVWGTYYVARPGDEPNRENVVIEIDSPYVDAWADYFSRLAEHFNNELGDNVAFFDENKLIIIGKVNDHENDIYYYEKFTEIEVDLA